jgi:hypothetical protein
MKKNGVSTALLTPDANGWRVCLPDGASQTVKTLTEAAAAAPAGASIHLALPAHATLLERLTLPSTNREELAGMVQLQLEKTLPYPIEEVTSDFDVIRQGENESTLISVAAHTPQLDQLCAPLRSTARLPRRVTLFAAHVAASCPPDQTVLCLWQEEQQLVVAICENGKVSTAQTFPGTDADTLLGELPAMLLRAELEGVPVDFDSIRIEHGCGQLRPALAEYFGKPVELVSFNTGLPTPEGNLLPAAWQAEQTRLESSGRLKQQLQVVAFIYLLLVAGAFVYLAWMKTRVRKIDVEIAATTPQVELVRAQQARWSALRPAIDPDRFPIEILRICQEARPSSEVKFNVFDYAPTKFTVVGEAPNAVVAIEYGDKLRAAKELADFTLKTPAPVSLKDDRWKFTFSGEL